MDQALVDKIVAEVLAAVESGDTAGPAPAGGGSFARVGRKLFVTAEMLQQRLAASDGPIELAANEVLTPAAKDLVEIRHLTVKRSAAALSPAMPPRAAQPVPLVSALAKTPAAGSEPVGLVIDKPDEKVESVLRALAHDGIGFTSCNETCCWMANLTGLCRAVAAGKLAAGVAIMPFAAEPIVMANKFDGIRACQGTCVKSVAAAVRRIGANVLILEHALSTFHELRAMARTFVTQRMVSGINTDVLAAIAKLERT